MQSLDRRIKAQDYRLFHEYLPDTSIEPIGWEVLPDGANEYFNSGVQSYDEFPPDFVSLWRITHGEGVTYVGRAIQSETKPRNVQDVLWLWGADLYGRCNGFGQTVLTLRTEDPFFEDKPYIAWTCTPEGFGQKGLGRRRVLLMNALSQFAYGLPLYSSRINDAPIMAKIWRRLLAEGYVEVDPTGHYDRGLRYRFKNRP